MSRSTLLVPRPPRPATGRPPAWPPARPDRRPPNSAFRSLFPSLPSPRPPASSPFLPPRHPPGHLSLPPPPPTCPLNRPAASIEWHSKQDLEKLWLCCAAVSLPHMFYFWLWRTPQVSPEFMAQDIRYEN